MNGNSYLVLSVLSFKYYYTLTRLSTSGVSSCITIPETASSPKSRDSQTGFIVLPGLAAVSYVIANSEGSGRSNLMASFENRGLPRSAQAPASRRILSNSNRMWIFGQPPDANSVIAPLFLYTSTFLVLPLIYDPTT